MRRRLFWADPAKLDTDPSGSSTPLDMPPEGELPNLVGSLLENGNHAPVIDIDHNVYVIPSSTPGHFHLYIDVEMGTEQYDRMLWAMVEAGVVGRGYYRHSMEERGQTTVRLPWVRKGDTEKPVAVVVDEEPF